MDSGFRLRAGAQLSVFQASILTWTPSTLSLMTALYSGSLLMRSGNFWLRFTSQLGRSVETRLRIRKGTPPIDYRTKSLSILSLAMEGYGGLGIFAEDETWGWCEKLAAVLNGDWALPELTHYCVGKSCCRDGRASTVTRIVEAMLRTIFRRLPTVPELSRWSKGVQSLDFWYPGMCCHRIVLFVFTDMMDKRQAFSHELGIRG